MTRYRSGILTTLTILEIIHKDRGTRIRRLITYANVPYTRMKSKLEELSSAGIVKVENSGDDGRVYVLTDKGRNVLFKLRELIGFLTSTGLIPEEPTISRSKTMLQNQKTIYNVNCNIYTIYPLYVSM
ncbi:MAG: winged helix-turn-helix domain-containing protein [Candidatus Geothermarchaeales archaeon]